MKRVSEDLDLQQALRRALVAGEEARARELEQRGYAEALAEELRRMTGERARDAEAEARLEARVEARTADHVEGLREADAVDDRRLQVGAPVDKYALGPLDGPPCLELIPICGARCCEFDFPLSTQDLDEGVIQWDHGRPYLIRHGANGACVHQKADGGCGAYTHRPAPCRIYDCRKDKRIWADYDARVLAPRGIEDPAEWSSTLNLLDRRQQRDDGLAAEGASMRRATTPGTDDPTR